MFRQIRICTCLCFVASALYATQAIGQETDQDDQQADNQSSEQQQRQTTQQDDQSRQQTRQDQDQPFDQDQDQDQDLDLEFDQQLQQRRFQDQQRDRFQQRDQDFERDPLDSRRFDERFDDDQARSFEDRDAQAQRQTRQQQLNFGAEFDTTADAMTVTNVNRGTLAAQIGVQQNDEILAVGGQRVSSDADVNRLLVQSSRAGQRVPIIVGRNGRRTTLFVEPSMLRESLAIPGQTFGTDLGVAWVTGANDQLVVRDVTGGLGRIIGLRARDAIVSVGGRRIVSPAQFERVIYDIDPVNARRLPIVVLRDGRRVTLYLEPDDLDYRFRDRDLYAGNNAWLGVTLDTRYQNQAVVEDVVYGSPADRAGVRTGDWIVRLNGRPVSSASHLTRLVDSMQPGEDVEIQVARRVSRMLFATLSQEEADEQPRQALRPNFDAFDEDVRIEERRFFQRDTLDDFDPDVDRRGLRDRLGPGERGLRDRFDRDELPDERPGVLRTPY